MSETYVLVLKNIKCNFSEVPWKLWSDCLLRHLYNSTTA
uniref:Uncharacterized protein n=1 Tax=Manihot esculenta TaxID=3983 RepID=A0A2C9WG13_MANES